MREVCKAAVIGAGPIGAALALALSRIDEQSSILIIDAEANAPVYLPDKPDVRIFALNEGSRALLDQLGVWPEIFAERCQPYQQMHVWDAQGSGSIEFDASDIEADQLGHIVEASLVQSKLLAAIERQPNIQILRPDKVTALVFEQDQALLQLKSGAEIQTELVCAADGAKSSLRSLAKIDASEDIVGQQAIVANIFHEKPNQNCAWQIFHSTGPLAFLPLDDFDGRHLSSIVWSLDSDEADRIKGLSDPDFELALGRALEERFGELSLASERFSFPLVQRHAKTYVRQSFALIGDAAHSIHPLAGLGANIGFQDVQALTKEVSRASMRGLSWGNPQILRRYQRERRLDNALVLKSMTGFKQLFGETYPVVSALRNLGLKSIDSMPKIKRRFIKQATMAK